jgi:hypothetical protein
MKVRADACRTALLVVAVLVVASSMPGGHGVQAHTPVVSQRGVVDPPTSFERALAEICSPCVKEAYSVATVQVPPLKLPVVTRLSGTAATRAGEIGFEVLRAYQVGRPDRQFLAIRVTLSIVAGGGRGEMYRLGVGLLDEAELPVLASTLAHIVQIAATVAGNMDPDSTEIDFQEGSLRVGLLRVRGDGVAYVQTGDPSILALRPVLEVPTALYLPASQIPTLVAIIGQVTAKIKALRGY